MKKQLVLIIMKVFLLFVVALMLVPIGAFAEGVSSFREDVLLRESEASFDISISLNYPSEREIKIPIFFDAKNLNYKANFKNLQCRQQTTSYGSDLICDISGLTPYERTLSISFIAEDPMKVQRNKFNFQNQVLIPFDAKDVFIKIVLPEGMVLLKDQIAFLPVDGQSSSDGRNIYVFWRKENLKQNDIFTAQVSYEPIIEASPTGMVIVASAVLFPTILILGFLFFRMNRKPEMTPSFVLPVLKLDEKKVVEALVKHGSGVNQKIIVQESGYSKAKVSKVLKSLVERGIVTFERMGRNNRIYWSENFKKKGKAG